MHGCKLVRRIGMKKVSTVSKDGQLSWLMREVTKLACPGSDVPAPPSTDVSDSTLITNEQGTNKKMRISERE